MRTDDFINTAFKAYLIRYWQRLQVTIVWCVFSVMVWEKLQLVEFSIATTTAFHFCLTVYHNLSTETYDGFPSKQTFRNCRRTFYRLHRCPHNIIKSLIIWSHENGRTNGGWEIKNSKIVLLYTEWAQFCITVHPAYYRYKYTWEQSHVYRIKMHTRVWSIMTCSYLLQLAFKLHLSPSPHHHLRVGDAPSEAWVWSSFIQALGNVLLVVGFLALRFFLALLQFFLLTLWQPTLEVRRWRSSVGRVTKTSPLRSTITITVYCIAK